MPEKPGSFRQALVRRCAGDIGTSFLPKNNAIILPLSRET